MLVRKRLAVAMASLLWLLWRSGSQPRRISYPGQQVALLNVGAFMADLVPALFLARRIACPRAAARVAGVRRQLLLGGFMTVSAYLGIETYQFAATPAAPQWPVLSDAPGDPPQAIVAIHRRDPQGTSYTVAEIEAMVRQAVALSGGMADLMTDKNSDGQIQVVIKPNLVQSKWSGTSGVVTDPRVVAAVVKIARESGAGKVTVAEGTADGDGRNSTWTAFRNAGYDANSDRKFDYDTSVDLFDLNDSGGTNQTDPNKVTLVTISSGVIRTQYWVPNILLSCDVLINVPTFKNHFNGTVTLSLKNRVGCAPNDIYHYPGLSFTKWALVHSVTSGFPCTVAPCPSAENDIVHRTLVDLNLIRPQELAVIDALIGVTNGPNNDPPTYPSPRMRMIVAGRDSLAVDTVCTLAMAYDPDQVPQLAWAASTGALGTRDRRYITVLGDHVAQVRYSFPEGYGGTTPAVRCDLAPPWIGGMTPAEGQQVFGVVPVAVSGVGDNVAAIKAELYVDGVYQATDAAAPFSFEWDTTGLPDGPHTITVTVYGAADPEIFDSRPARQRRRCPTIRTSCRRAATCNRTPLAASPPTSTPTAPSARGISRFCSGATATRSIRRPRTVRTDPGRPAADERPAGRVPEAPAGLRSALHPTDQIAGGVGLRVAHIGQADAQAHEGRPLREVLQGVVGPLGMDVRAHQFEQRVAGRLVEARDQRHPANRGHDLHPLGQGLQRAVRALVRPDRGVAVDRHDQCVSFGRRPQQVTDVADMEDVKGPVGEHDRATGGAKLAGGAGQLAAVQDDPRGQGPSSPARTIDARSSSGEAVAAPAFMTTTAPA